MIYSHGLFSQKYKTTFDQIRFDEVLRMMEEQTDLIFNYDSDILKENLYSGSLDLSMPLKSLSQLLYDSPLAFERNKQTILIFKPKPKQYRVCGKVRDYLSKDILIGANLIAEQINQGAQTDDSGFFELSIKAFKNQRISVSYIGYETKTYQLQELDTMDCQDLFLSIDQQLWGEEIIVTDYILDGITVGQDYGAYEMNYHQLSKQHSVVEHDILKTAQLLPGILSIDESATNLQIRGSTADQNLIMWEGATIYQPAHLFGMISALNPFSVQNVNIYKGAYDPKYDNRVGGIINISMSDSIKAKSHGSTGLTLTEAHVNLELPLIAEKLAVNLSGRHSINSVYNSPPLTNYTNKVFQFSKIDDQSEDVEEGSINAEKELNFYDWNAKVKYRLSKNLYFNAGLYRNSQNFEYDISFPGDSFNATDKIQSKTEALSSRLDWDMNEKWKTSFAFIQSKYNSAYNYDEEEDGDILAAYSQLNDISDQSFSFSNSYTDALVSVMAGYDYNVKSVNYSLVNDNIYEPYFDDENSEQGHFHNIFASIKAGSKKFKINAGIRVSHYVEQSEWFLSPRLSIQYSISPQFKLKAEGGVFHQFISQLSDYGTSFVDVQNPLWILNTSENEISQRANKFASGFIYQEKGWLLDAEAYFSRTEGLSTLSPQINLLATSQFSRGRSTAMGLDILIKKRWSKFNTWINYSLGKNTYLFPDISDQPFAALNDIRHTISMVSSYQYQDFQIAVTGSYHSGLPFSRPIGLLEIFEDEEEESYFVVDYAEINNDRLKPYARIDLSINYRPTFKKMKQMNVEFSLSILNLLKRENEFAKEFSLNFENELEIPRLTFVERSLLQRTPLLLMRVYW